MTVIVYVPAPGYDSSEKGVINLGGGISFDVGAALSAGGGQISADSAQNPGLIGLLDHFPGLIRSGNTPGPVVVPDSIGPVIAHSGSNPKAGDVLARGPDGLFASQSQLSLSQLTPKVVSSDFPNAGVSRIDFSGHSIPGCGGTIGGDHNGFPDRLARMVGAHRRANIAKGGSISCWPSSGASGDGGYSWILNMFRPPNSGDGSGVAGIYPPRTTLAVIHNHENDIAAIGAASMRPSMEALKTIISRYCTSALFEDTDASWTWGTAMSAATGSNPYSGQSMHYAQWGGSVNAQQFGQWACPNDYPGNLVIAIGLSQVPGAVGAGATITVALTIDGVEYDYTFSLDKGGHCDAENGKTNGTVLRFGRSDCGLGLSVANGGLGIPALAPGAHTVKVALKSSNASGAYFIVDYAQIEADPLDGPVIVVPSNFRATSPTNNGYNLWSSGSAHGPAAATDPMNDASIASANTQLQAALADFPGRCVYVDIDTPLGKNTQWFSGDYTHPNNIGHALIAQTIYDTLLNSKLLTDKVLSRTSPRSLGVYDGGMWIPLAGDYGVTVGPGFSNTWAAYGVETPAFQKELRRRVILRGYVKQTGAAAANSVITSLGTNTGYAPFAGQAQDRAVPVFNGAAYQLGVVRVDTTNGVFMGAGGSVAASSGNSIDTEYSADGI